MGNVLEYYVTGDITLERAFNKGKQNPEENLFGEANSDDHTTEMERVITVSFRRLCGRVVKVQRYESKRLKMSRVRIVH